LDDNRSSPPQLRHLVLLLLQLLLLLVVVDLLLLLQVLLVLLQLATIQHQTHRLIPTVHPVVSLPSRAHHSSMNALRLTTTRTLRRSLWIPNSIFHTRLNRSNVQALRGFASKSSTPPRAPPPPTPPSPPSVEKQYQRKTPLEHVLIRPDTYVGSTEVQESLAWLPNSAAAARYSLRNASFVPALYKIFDEILVNALDNRQRDSSMAHLDVRRRRGAQSASPFATTANRIPVVLHATEGIYVPELVHGTSAHWLQFRRLHRQRSPAVATALAPSSATFSARAFTSTLSTRSVRSAIARPGAPT
jgi:hypothetical protein